VKKDNVLPTGDLLEEFSDGGGEKEFITGDFLLTLPEELKNSRVQTTRVLKK